MSGFHILILLLLICLIVMLIGFAYGDWIRQAFS